MRISFLGLIMLLLLVPAGWGQSASELAQKFPHHEVYEIEPGVVMSAKFASDGLVCEMQVEESHFIKGVVAPQASIDFDKIDALVERLVPASERGEKERDFPSGLMSRRGSVMDRTDLYTNIAVDVIWSVKGNKKSVLSTSSPVVIIKWRHRSCS